MRDLFRQLGPWFVFMSGMMALALWAADAELHWPTTPAAVTVDTMDAKTLHPTNEEMIHRLLHRYYDLATRVKLLETTPSSLQRQIDDDRQDNAALRKRIRALEDASGPGGGRGGGGSPRFP